MRRLALFVLLSLAAPLTGTSAFASDGALEISQACATAGCFSGDTPGLPVTIRRSGS